MDAHEVRRAARLARLEVEESDLEGLAGELSRILELFERIASVDTRDVEPMAHPLALHQRMRPDEVTEPDQRDRLLALAPASADGLYLVPQVIE